MEGPPQLDQAEKEEAVRLQRFLTIGENFFVGYSPEREDPGNQKFTTKISNLGFKTLISLSLNLSSSFV